MTIKRINRGRGHSYTVDGKKANGVTTVIGAVWPKPALQFWATKTVAQTAVDMEPSEWEQLAERGRDGAILWLARAADRVRDEAASRGTAVHKLAEKLIVGEEIAPPDELIGYAEGLIAFMDEWRPRPVLMEKVVGSYKYGYAGTFDLVADLPDGRRILWDYKSGSVFGSVALQLAAYRWADFYVAEGDLEMPMTEVGIDDCKVVRVFDGGYEVIPFVTDESVFRVFLHTLQVSRDTAVEKSWKGEPETAPDWKAAA
jgi:hypothetical protein